MKIIIRANGGSTIGMGHIMRCSVLAAQLRSFARVVFASDNREEFQPGLKYVESIGYHTIKLDPDNVTGHLQSLEADALITDSYDVDEHYFDALKDSYPVCGYVDDTNLFRFNVDFILNQNVYAPDLEYDVPANAVRLLGADYLLLRDEFHNLPEKETTSVLKNVLITLGGSDNNNLTEQLIKEVTQRHPELIFHVVVGPSFTHADKLDKFTSDTLFLYSRPKMSTLMLRMDMAISACGSTIYELAACGVPTLGIVIANNQRQIAEKMHNLNLLKYANNVKDVAKLIASYDYQVRYNMARKAQRTFHSQGAANAADAIKELIIDKTILGEQGAGEE